MIDWQTTYTLFCFETIQDEMPAWQIVLVEPDLLQQCHKDGDRQLGLNIITKGFSVQVTEFTSMAFPVAIFEVLQEAEWATFFKAVYIVCGYMVLALLLFVYSLCCSYGKAFINVCLLQVLAAWGCGAAGIMVMKKIPFIRKLL